jgi:DNA-binding MarR family transcriptional regulator
MPPTLPAQTNLEARATGRSDARADALDADTLDLHRRLTELKRVYQFRDRDRICCHDISVTQCWALESLVRRGSLTLNELASELFLEKSTASRVVDALERKRYVRRARHPRDGRSVLLKPTAAGARLYGTIESEMLVEERRLLSEFDPEIRRSMVRLIGRLVDAASARIVTRGGTCCSIGSLSEEES